VASAKYQVILGLKEKSMIALAPLKITDERAKQQTDIEQLFHLKPQDIAFLFLSVQPM